MKEILTSNQVTGIYGFPPAGPPNPSKKILKGFVVYIDLTGPMIKARTFWSPIDGTHLGIDSQDEFENRVLNLIKATGIPSHATGGKFPEAFEDRINTIEFGWQAISVSYILDSPFASFYELDVTDSLNQPIIFRRDKIVKGKNDKFEIVEYCPNYTFFNLQSIKYKTQIREFAFYNNDKSEYEYNVSILRFENHMLIDQNGQSLGERPLTVEEATKIRYEYCMDMPILIDQAKLTATLDAVGTSAESKLRLIGDVSADAITIVFDPPQGNGGGGGVPTYP